jgi:uncharacterized protein (TIGR02285 family)
MPFRTIPFWPALFALLPLLSPAPGWAKDSITWMEAVMPPYLIQEGSNKDQGYGDVITRILQEQLPEYTHEKMVTNITRHFYKFKQGEKVCSVGLFRTPEREDFMYFSIPSFLTLPAVIIIKKESLAQFGGRSTIRLQEVLNGEKLIIGLSKDRSYGTSTDNLLSKHKGEGHLVESAGQELSLNLFKMLMKGRVDGIIGLPEEALYQAEQMGIRDQLMTLAIEENQNDDDAWLSAVGCSKNEWGRTVIDKLNGVLLRERPTERYRAAYERWLDPNGIEQYRRVYQGVFLEKNS